MNNRTLKNAAWIIGCKIVQALLGLVVTMLSARYLGPSGYGLISYAASIVAFFVPIMQLGLNSTLVQEIVNRPDDEGETLGTALTMCLVSGLACIVGIASFTALANRGEPETIAVCVLYSILLIFQSMEMIQYWFQAKLLSKYTSIAMLVSYAVVSAYKIVLLITGSSIYWFAIAQALDFGIIAVALLIIYKRIGTQKLRFSYNRAKELFSKSKHYILSGLMVTVFAQTDRIMLKMMMDEEAVGYYSAAVTCASMTAFVFVAIIDSARPSILEGKKETQAVFEYRMKALYAIIIMLALLQSAGITLLSDFVVWVLYGAEYGLTVNALRIIVWYTTFSYLGAVRDIWILAEGKQRYLWMINLSGAGANVILNFVLIPIWGINGAAVASLVTQIFTNVIVGCFMKEIRGSNKLMIQALNLRFMVSGVKTLLNKANRTSKKHK